MYSCKFSPDGSLLALGSRDHAIYIYQVKDSYRRFIRQGRCLGHTAPVVHIDWSSDGLSIQSNSADHELMVWTVSTGRPVRDIDSIRDMVWSTSECVVQWSSLGLWGETPDTADPSHVSLTRSRELVGVGDTWGRVKLFSNPACQPRSLCHTYTGHSSQVTNTVESNNHGTYSVKVSSSS